MTSSPPLRPSRLCPGDLIGLLAPASPVAEPARIEAGVRYLEKNGYRVKLGAHVADVHGYLAGRDADRAADLHAMVADPEVKAILCLRGGYGTTRLLPLLDFELFARHPKILSGFSDITALQLALWHRCRLITFHGPMAAVDFGGSIDPLTEQWFWEILSGADRPHRILLGEGQEVNILASGRARGPLLGGNLSLMAALAGTPFMPDFSGSLVIIEEIGEEPYRVDRMLTQLHQAGTFSHVHGVVTGQFSECEPKDTTRPSLSVDDLLKEFADHTRVPFITGCRFGHVTPKLTLPVGATAELETAAGVLTLDGPLVA